MQQRPDRGLVGCGVPVPQSGAGHDAGPLEEPRARQELGAAIEGSRRDDTVAENFVGGAGDVSSHRTAFDAGRTVGSGR